MARTKSQKTIVMRVPGVELLRLCHLGATIDDAKVQNAAASIFALLALALKQEMVNIPEEMAVHYHVLAKL